MVPVTSHPIPEPVHIRVQYLPPVEVGEFVQTVTAYTGQYMYVYNQINVATVMTTLAIHYVTCISHCCL